MKILEKFIYQVLSVNCTHSQLYYLCLNKSLKQHFMTLWTEVLGHLHVTPTGAFMTPHHKFIGFKMEMVSPLQQ